MRYLSLNLARHSLRLRTELAKSFALASGSRLGFKTQYLVDSLYDSATVSVAQQPTYSASFLHGLAAAESKVGEFATRRFLLLRLSKPPSDPASPSGLNSILTFSAIFLSFFKPPSSQQEQSSSGGLELGSTSLSYRQDGTGRDYVYIEMLKNELIPYRHRE